MRMWVCFFVGLFMTGNDCETTELVGSWATAAQPLALVAVAGLLIMLMAFLLLQILSNKERKREGGS